MRDKHFSENLAHMLDIQLHGPSSIQKTDPQTECGICYAQNLPIGNPNIRKITQLIFCGMALT